jgi:hypothetical protein
MNTESKLRKLCAWYEWTEPPQTDVAQLLQGMADRAPELDPAIAENTVEIFDAYRWALRTPKADDTDEMRVLRQAMRDLDAALADAPECRKPEIRERLIRQDAILWKAEHE